MDRSVPEGDREAGRRLPLQNGGRQQTRGPGGEPQQGRGHGAEGVQTLLGEDDPRPLTEGGEQGEGDPADGDPLAAVDLRITRADHDGDADEDHRGAGELSGRQSFAAGGSEEAGEDRRRGPEDQGAVRAEAADGGKEQGVADGQADDARTGR